MPFPKPWMLLLVLGLSGVFNADWCHGGIIVGAQSKSISSSSSTIRTKIDLFVDLTGPDDGASIVLSNYQVRLDIIGPNLSGSNGPSSFVTPNAPPELEVLGFTNVASALPLMGLGDTEFAMTSNFFPSDSFEVSDMETLASVELEIQPNVVGEFEIRVVVGTDRDTAFLNRSFAPLAITGKSGKLTISGANADQRVIPEPRTLPIFAMLGFLGALRTRSRTTRSRALLATRVGSRSGASRNSTCF